ncbi:MAG: HAD-IA family hydrolase [Aeromonas sp.]
MQFYRRWQPVQALSFDLDDTLYDNGPVMARAEQAWLTALTQCQPQAGAWHRARWQQAKRTALERDPRLRGDVTAWRWAAAFGALRAAGGDELAARAATDQLLAEFLAVRAQVRIAPEVHQLLAALQAQYPLIVITNGNVDLAAIGLAGYFTAVFKASLAWPMKPAPAMFSAAAAAVNLAPAQILHIGDHPLTDVAGAKAAGFRAAWLSPRAAPLPALLPDVRITQLAELADVLLPARKNSR